MYSKPIFYFISGILLFYSGLSYSQQSEKDPDASDDLVLIPDIMAEFPGGYSAFYKYLDKKINCNAARAKTNQIHVVYIVDSTGYIRKGSVEILGEISDKCKPIVIEAFEESPKWSPAYDNELKKNVSIKIRIPFLFF